MAHSAHQLPPDAQAIVLLCAHMGSTKGQGAAPLSTGEYNRLADWLNKAGLRPGDLLTSEGRAALEAFPPHEELTPDRVRTLLDRGAALAFEVETWTTAGGWILARSDTGYPAKLKERLKHHAPPLLYGVGPQALLADGALSIVGSQNASPAALAFVEDLAARCAREGLTVVSGGARGVGKQAMDAALDAGGTVVGALSHGLAQTARTKRYRNVLMAGQLTLISAVHPKAPFAAGNARDRTKHIYALGEGALVAHTANGSGVTWAGATETLRHAWVPLFVRAEAPVPDGNRALLKKGGLPVDRRLLRRTLELRTWLNAPGPLNDVAPAADALMAAPDSGAEDRSPATDEPPALLPLVWPALRDLLHEPRSARAVCEHFADARLTQVRDWLTVAVEQGLVVRQERPVRYVLRAETPPGDDATSVGETPGLFGG